MLIDIPADRIAIAGLPAAPEGKRVASVDVVVRLTDS
jgi:Fur family iron response transcriptional regulator